MTPAEVEIRLQSARGQLERVCKLLESPTPEILDLCAAEMQRAIAGLDAARSSMAAPSSMEAPSSKAVDNAVRGEARRVRAVARRARALLDLAAKYHFGWQRILAGRNGGYTMRGALAPILVPSRISIEG